MHRLSREVTRAWRAAVAAAVVMVAGMAEVIAGVDILHIAAPRSIRCRFIAAVTVADLVA